MKVLLCSRFIFAVILSNIIIIMVGCSVNITPGPSDVPPTDNTYPYYGEPSYDAYRSVSPPAPIYNYNSSYDSSYDPWTMSSYYERFSSVPQGGGSSDNSGSLNTSATRSEDRRPSVKDRNPTSSYQSKAPRSDNGITARESEKTSPESNSSSIVNQKTKRSVKRDALQSSQERQPSDETKRKSNETRSSSKKARSSRSSSEPAKSDDKEDEQED